MKRMFTIRFDVAGLVLCLMLLASTLVVAGDKPLLSTAIARAIDTNGVAAATRNFARNYERDKDRYVLDMKGIADLSNKYSRAKNYKAAAAVTEMAAPYIAKFTADALKAQAPKTAKRMEEMRRQRLAAQEKYRQRERKRREAFQKKHDVALTKPVPSESVSGAKPLINPNVEYSAVSYLDATNPGGRKFHSTLYISHAKKKARFENREKRHEPISIFRYDKRVMWLVHREKKRYEGVKLYQEFKLTGGMGIGSHIDNLMHARRALLSPKGLKNVGKETVNGQKTTHYYKKVRNRGYEEGHDIHHYWVSDDGILVRMKFTSVEVARTLDTRKIRRGRQTDNLFVPPADYRKAGTVINWKKEKRKLDAGL
jgi:hypothetical protein